MAGTPDTATGRRIVTQDINVLALVKGEERYIFLYDDEHKSEALRTLGRFASNPELSFSWYDAAVLSQRIRQTAMEQRTEAEAEAEPAAASPLSVRSTNSRSAKDSPKATPPSPSAIRGPIASCRTFFRPTKSAACSSRRPRQRRWASATGPFWKPCTLPASASAKPSA